MFIYVTWLVYSDLPDNITSSNTANFILLVFKGVLNIFLFMLWWLTVLLVVDDITKISQY